MQLEYPGMVSQRNTHRMNLGWREHPIYQALAFSLWPKEFLERRFGCYGEGFSFTLPGLGEMVVGGRSESAQELFGAPPDQFTRLQNSPVEPILGSESLMLVAGERHLEERKLLSVPFRGENMRAFGDIIAADTLKHLRSVGDDFVAQDLARAVALDVIIGCVFGVQNAQRKATFHKAISRMIGYYTDADHPKRGKLISDYTRS